MRTFNYITKIVELPCACWGFAKSNLRLHVQTQAKRKRTTPI